MIGYVHLVMFLLIIVSKLTFLCTRCLFVEETQPRILSGVPLCLWNESIHLLLDLLCTSDSIHLTANHIHELAFRVHEVEENRVIHQVILARLHIGRSGEVNTILFAHILHLLVCSSQTNNGRMEIFQVLLDDFWRVSGRITRDEYRLQLNVLFLLQRIQHLSQFIQFIWTHIRAVGESKVDDGEFLFVVLQIFLGKRLVIGVDQCEVSANQRLSHTSLTLDFSLDSQLLFLVGKPPRECSTCNNQHNHCLPRSKFNTITFRILMLSVLGATNSDST